MEQKQPQSTQRLFSSFSSLSNTVLFFATSMASIKDIKATGYIFIIFNHVVFTALCLWGCGWKWKYLLCTGAQLFTVYQEKKKKKSQRSRDETEMQETKRENKMWASHRSLSLPLLLSWWSVISSHLARTLWRRRGEREGGEGENFLMFFLFNVFVLSPTLSCLGPRSGVERRWGVAGV